MINRDKTADVLFMSSGMFEHLNDAESFVFSHIAFFASQSKYNKGVFKQTTRAICNKVAYSPNTVRKAIESLIEKKFLSQVTSADDYKEINYSYIDQVAHKLKIGEAEYAKTFAYGLSMMLQRSTSKQKTKVPRDLTFFKVSVGKLKAALPTVMAKSDKNKSKHLHKTLIMHGYLYNQAFWNSKKERGEVSRSVSFLARLLHWSSNTVRRVINTLSDLGNITFKYAEKVLSFFTVKPLTHIVTTWKSLRSALKASGKSKTQSSVTPIPAAKKEPTPAEAAAFLASLSERQGT